MQTKFETNPALVRVISKVIADKADILPLGNANMRFKSVVFFGGKGTSKTNNATTAHIHLQDANGDWQPAIAVPAGQWSIAFSTEMGYAGTIGADQFKLEVTTNNDGIVAVEVG